MSFTRFGEHFSFYETRFMNNKTRLWGSKLEKEKNEKSNSLSCQLLIEWRHNFFSNNNKR